MTAMDCQSISQIPPDSRGEFRETKMSVNSSDVEQNLLARRKSRGKVSINVLKNSFGWNFTLSIVS